MRLRRLKDRIGVARRLRAVLLASSAFVSASALPAKAQTAQTWNGITSTDWFTGTNWDSGTPPSAGPPADSATLDTVTPNPTVADGTAGSYSAIDLSGLNVGFTGIGSLTINNGASFTVTNGNAVIGGDLSGVPGNANGTVIVDGATFNVTGTPTSGGMLVVGGSGTGSFTVQNSATVTAVDSYVGFGTGANGTVTVTGVGTTWTNSDGGGNGQNIVGNEGTGVFNVYNGATVNVEAGTIVGASPTGTGTINISGAGSTWTASNITLLGGNTLSDGGRGTINVSDGGSYVAHNQVVIGFKHGGVGNLNVTGGATVTVDSNATVNLGLFNDATGTLTVSGAGSIWDATAGGDMYVGGNAGGFAPAGGTGTVNVLDGGALNMQGAMYLGRGSSGGNGTLNVSGTGSAVSLTTATDALFVGYTGVGVMTISNGGHVTNDGSAYLGFSAGSTGTVVIDGTNSSWTSNGLVTVIGGNDGSVAGGTGSVTVRNGGTLNTGQARLGFDGTGAATGTVTVTGANSRWNASDIYVGFSGAGTLNITGGGRVNASGLVSIGGCGCTTGAAFVTGAGSLLTVAGNLTVGDVGGGTLSILDSGQVNVTGAVLGNGGLTIGAGSVLSAASYLPAGTFTTTIGLRGAASGQIGLGAGTAGLDGALVITGHNVGRTTYTLVQSADLAGSRFSSVTYADALLRNPVLTYTAGDVLLTVDPYLLSSLLPTGANMNQQNVARAIDKGLATGATPSSGIENLFYLTGDALLNGLTQVSGEPGASIPTAGFAAMNQFINAMMDGPGGAGGFSAPLGFAEENAYAPKRKLSRAQNEAYAAVTPRDRLMPTFASRWNVWATGYGGNSTINGDAAAGSHATSTRVYGTAVGADYRATPDTRFGFALGGAGTNFTVDNALGGGRADVFQAGAYARHTMGAAYIAAAVAYAWQDITTDRTVTVSGTDRLHAELKANALSARLESGWRYAMPAFAVTPYAGLQSTAFYLPSYAETATSGSNQFALSYGSKTVTATRGELGFRLDKAMPLNDAVVTLRGRAAWAHDWNTDRSAIATFQSLPGATFTVNGATPSANAALLSAGADIAWGNGWTVAATFDGEFSNTTRGYAGKGSLRYAW